MQLRIILRNLMKERRLTFRSLSKLSGCSESSLKDWSNGISPRDLDAVKRVADTLGVSFEYLIFGAEANGNAEPTTNSQLVSADTRTIYNGWAHISIAIPSVVTDPLPLPTKDKAEGVEG